MHLFCHCLCHWFQLIILCRTARRQQRTENVYLGEIIFLSGCNKGSIFEISWLLSAQLWKIFCHPAQKWDMTAVQGADPGASEKWELSMVITLVHSWWALFSQGPVRWPTENKIQLFSLSVFPSAPVALVLRNSHCLLGYLLVLRFEQVAAFRAQT